MTEALQAAAETQTIVDDAQALIEEATRLHDDWNFMVKTQRLLILAKIHEGFD
ncbi:MAG: hypothetical protein WC365_10315 [Candidatus Babeliales bacterium]|jgi:hypothetical protein